MKPKAKIKLSYWQAWLSELHDFEEIEEIEETRTKIRVRNAEGKIVSIYFPHKPWINIYPSARQVGAPLWFCIKTGLTKREDYSQ